MIKQAAKRAGLEPILVGPYRVLVKRPYWLLRRNVFEYPAIREIGGVTAEFTVDHESDLLYHEFDSERPIIADILAELDDGDVFYDVGANIGIYSCFVANCDVDAMTVAIEPSPVAYEKLERNLARNSDAHCISVVVTDTEGEVEFAVDVQDVQSRQSKIDDGDDASRYDTMELPATTLDALVADEDLPTPSVVKIDVEGAELKVLRGMEAVLDSVETLYCEIHHSALRDGAVSGDNVVGLLESKQFEVESFSEREGGNEFIKASRTIPS